MVLYQVDREYARASLSYEKGLRQRNKILESYRERRAGGPAFAQMDIGATAGKQESYDRRKLYFWDQLLIKNGNSITKKRSEFIEYLNSFKRIGNVGNFSIEYDESTISEERLLKYEEEEILAGTTLVGPHRDNFKFKIINLKLNEEKDLAIYGSRGEQRLAILWLKLGELSFIEEQTKNLPVLLLDDIFSELDVKHRELVFGLIIGHQTIITTADLGMVERKWLGEVKILNLDKD